MIRQWTSLAALIACFGLLHASPTFAQQGGQGGGGQAAGSASTLSNTQGYGLDSRFGGSGFDTYTSGSSAMGSTTAGARAGSAGFGQSVTGGAARSTGNFGGLGGLGLGGIGGLGGMGGAYGFGRNMFGQNQQQGAQTGNKKIRTRARLGFTAPAPAPAAVSASFTKVITRVLERGDYGSGSVNVTVEGQVVVLTGTVDSPHARDVAERLALLEPGISDVRNELTVRAAAPTPGTSPTPNSVDQPQ